MNKKQLTVTQNQEIYNLMEQYAKNRSNGNRYYIALIILIEKILNKE